MGCEQIAADKLSKFMNRDTMMWKKWICARGDFFSRLMCKLSLDHRLKGKIPIEFQLIFDDFFLLDHPSTQRHSLTEPLIFQLSVQLELFWQKVSVYPLDFERFSANGFTNSNILHENSNVSVPRSTCTHPHRLSTPRNQSRVSAHLSSFINQ